jgi:predicted lactoylglutathione lyase
MYQHSFDDLDGHHWEYLWIDPNGAPKQEWE